MRLKYIDSAKGFAMLLIVWGHTVTFSDPVSQWASAFKISLFYIVTGLLLSMRAEDGKIRKTPVKKLLLSMGIPYAFYSALSLLASAVIMSAQNRGIDFLIDKILLTVTLNGVSTLWFLPSIFFGRLISERVLCRRIPLTVKTVAAVAIPILLVLSAEFIPEIGLHKAVQSVLTVILKVFVAFWFIGVGFEAGKSRQGNSINQALISMVLLICGSVVAFLNRGVDLNNGLFGSRPLLFFLSGVLCSFGIIGIFAFLCEKLPCKLTAFVGKNSLFVMVTHLPLYIVPIVSVLVSKFITAEGIAYNYMRAIVVFLFVLIIEWVLISVKNNITARVKNKQVCEFLKYI